MRAMAAILTLTLGAGVLITVVIPGSQTAAGPDIGASIAGLRPSPEVNAPVPQVDLGTISTPAPAQSTAGTAPQSSASVLAKGSVAGTDSALVPPVDLAKTTRLGKPAVDLGLTFVVSGIKFRTSPIGKGPSAEAPSTGRFALVAITALNRSKQAQIVDDGLASIVVNGRRYRANTGAGMLLNAKNGVWHNTLKPGGRLVYTVVFDVPPTGQASFVQLKATPISPGVPVLLQR